ncbi:MAG: hypothetical protein DI535_14335 [Citrobacter freundii]|nr:MAG: hypothetical protein DI535_14335 [Citrobacter freundii]
MKKISIFICIAVLLVSCGSPDTPNTDNKENTKMPPGQSANAKTSKQLNLTILLDLSDRIDSSITPSQPQHYQRDTILINHLTNYFIREMELKGGHMAKGKMRVVFQPTPSDSNINDAAAKLKVDLSPMKPPSKKVVHDGLGQTVNENIGRIYSIPLSQSEWPGSDIWRFFKNDVKDVAVDPDTTYRNVLVIFTDGYIYHEDSKDKAVNRFAYITPELLDKYRLRQGSADQKMQQLDFGLITKRSDLQDLEVLVLEVTPSAGHKNDEDIIRSVLNKWFTEMKVKRWAIFNSDLPTTTKPKIDGFLNN